MTTNPPPPSTMTTNDWITDRRPTEADGDEAGDVKVRRNPNDNFYSYLHWSQVSKATPWKHTAFWQPPTPEPEPEPTTTTPRKFKETPRRTVMSATIHTIDAIDDDGVAWWMITGPDGPEPKWYRHPPLPAKEASTNG